MGRQAIDDRAAGIAEAEQFGHFVEGFAGGIVAGLAEQAIVEALADLEEVGVAAADHQGQGGISHRGSGAFGFQDTAWMWPSMWLTAISGNAAREAQGFGVGEPDQQRADQARPDGDGDGGEIFEPGGGLAPELRGPPARWRAGARARRVPGPRRRTCRAWPSARRRRKRARARRLRPRRRRFRRRRIRCPGCALIFRVAGVQFRVAIPGDRRTGRMPQAGGVVEESGGFPGATLRGAAGFDKEGARGMSGLEAGNGIADAAEDDSQLLVEVVRGRGNDGACSIDFVRSLHA